MSLKDEVLAMADQMQSMMSVSQDNAIAMHVDKTGTPSIVYEGVQSDMYPRCLFVYSSYWGKWSRVLRYYQYGKGDKQSVEQVEVDMLPLDADRKINIRCHVTPRGDKDIITRFLPHAEVKKMVERFGEELTQRLLHEDFLSQIDFELYRKHNNGGAEFELIKIK